MSLDKQFGVGGGSNPDPIGRILASDETLMPSSGFLAEVMGRVKEEAAVPAPIPFPWKRAVPGFVLVLCVFGWILYKAVRTAVLDTQRFELTLPHLSTAVGSALAPAAWVVLALAVSLLSWVCAGRMARGSGLL